MTRATPKKTTNGIRAPKTADIKSFFRKTPSDQTAPRKTVGTGGTLEDVKPNVAPEGKRVNGGSRKGKEKAIVGGENSTDPVVISSDEDDSAPPKRPRTGRSPKHNGEELPASPGAGPSRSPSPPLIKNGSCSPPPKVFGPVLPPKPPSPRPAFEGVPDFQPPPNWPSIVNTASNPDEDLDDDDFDGGGDDADSQHPGMFEEEDPNDTHLLEGDDAEIEVEGEVVEEIQPERPLETLGGPRGESLDLTMEWDEGDDEGMGMEEPDDYDEPPSRPGNRAGGRSKNGEVDKCPMCSKTIKGKSAAVGQLYSNGMYVDHLQLVQKHINSCLDTSGSSRASRPITSFGHGFSPAPSSPSPPPETEGKGPNAFSVLMSGHKEKAQWKTAEDDLRRDGKRTYGRRPAPFYKVCLSHGTEYEDRAD